VRRAVIVEGFAEAAPAVIGIPISIALMIMAVRTGIRVLQIAAPFMVLAVGVWLVTAAASWAT
jgi:hypothetical protein